ncbi:hypothetical protein [Halapricum salinum]|uniref:DUF4013 domain-containing protein n=1 Tax=Halapricum salinum TaxID=1457250 RepID=A0A4D6H912_9EURY|nr:hypothetical protein [Halapricum salinum]QCC49991.1 hypothetical protein DV733_01585 [Halapricum salinum]
MTVDEAATTNRQSDDATSGLWLLRRGWFVLAGLLATAALVGVRSLSIPLAETTYQLEFPYLSFAVSLVPAWVAPVTLRPEALWGLKPAYLAVTVGLWTLAVLAVVIAAGLFWWGLDRDSGVLAPLSRLGWLVAYGLAAVVLTVFGSDLLVGSLPADWAGLEWGWTLLLALVAGRLFVAPVAIVRDGRRPLDAVRWSIRSLAGVRWTVRCTGLVLLLAFASRVVTAPFGALGGGLVGLALTVAVGTALVGSAHAYAMAFVYDLVAGNQTEGRES